MPRQTTSNRITTLDDRLDRLESKVDDGFAAVHKRFESMDKRFDEQGSRSQALHEASEERFRNLYDLIESQGAKTDARFTERQKDIQANTASLHAILQNHERRLLLLEAPRKKPRTR